MSPMIFGSHAGQVLSHLRSNDLAAMMLDCSGKMRVAQAAFLLVAEKVAGLQELWEPRNLRRIFYINLAAWEKQQLEHHKV